ncbi:MAG: hypothetical protein AAF698_03210 [Pseudomonadota bacterium]
MRKRHNETRSAATLSEGEDDDALDRLVSDEIDSILESVDVLGERAKQARRARRPAATRRDDVVRPYPSPERTDVGRRFDQEHARPSRWHEDREEDDVTRLARPKARRDRTPADRTSGPAEVIGLSARRQVPEDSLFSSEEEAFLTRTIAWLRPRPNADLLLEEIWRAAIEADQPADDLDMAADFPLTDDDPLAHFGTEDGDLHDPSATEEEADHDTLEEEDQEDFEEIDDGVFDHDTHDLPIEDPETREADEDRPPRRGYPGRKDR